MASNNKRAPKTNKPKLSIKEKRAAKKAKKALAGVSVLPAATKPTG